MRAASHLQNKNRTGWCALLLGLALTAPALADTLSWEASVEEAAASNPDLRAARANLEAADYQARAAYSGFLPQVSAGASHSEVSGNAVVIGPTAPDSTSLTATQNLFAGFQDKARVEQAAGNRDVADANLAAARARLSQDLKTAYTGLLYAQDYLELETQIVKRLEENVRLVELRFEGGRENKGSYLLTRATLEQARYDQLQARNALASAQALLARVLGRGDAADVALSGRVPVSDPPQNPDFRALAGQTPDYRVALSQEKVASAGVTLARGGFYPSVNLSGSLAREGDGWSELDARRRSWTVGLTVPLFSGGKDYYGTLGASSSLAAASSTRENVERQALVRLKQVWATYVESAALLKVNEAFVEAAETRARIARAQYNNGLISFNDWNLIENDLILRNKNYLASRRDRVLAEAAWEQAQGKGVIP